jgi:hypothetical protein
LLVVVILAYLVILAVNTSHITTAEKYRSRTPCPGEYGFFSVMSTDRRYGRQESRTAKTLFPG